MPLSFQVLWRQRRAGRVAHSRYSGETQRHWASICESKEGDDNSASSAAPSLSHSIDLAFPPPTRVYAERGRDLRGMGKCVIWESCSGRRISSHSMVTQPSTRNPHAPCCCSRVHPQPALLTPRTACRYRDCHRWYGRPRPLAGRG